MDIADQERERRIALALGAEPIAEAQYLLPPIALPESVPLLPEGPHPPTEFIIDVREATGAGAGSVEAGRVKAAFAPAQRAELNGARLWAIKRSTRTDRAEQWQTLDALPEEARIGELALTWELSGLFTQGNEAIAELAGYVLRTSERAAYLGLYAIPRETPAEAVARAARLIALKTQFARSVEMRLLPQGRAFPARAVWQTLYALGLTWGAHDLFHWRGGTPASLFTVSGLGHPIAFLPERAAEGEGLAGLALAFELPLSPAPLDVYDRMGVALSYLRHHLGGRPLTPDGAELDSERLYADRDALAAAVQEMSRAGIAPGTPDAERFF